MKMFLKSIFAVVSVAVYALTSSVQAQTLPADLVGSYQAQLFGATNPSAPSGSVDVTVSSNRVASGQIKLPGGKSYSFKATLTLEDDQGSAYVNNFVVQKGPFPAGIQNVQMNLRVYTSGQVTGSVIGIKVDQIYTMGAGLKFATFTGSSSAPWAGTYTMAMTPAAEGSSGDVPAGAGYATLAVKPNGGLVAKVVLGDGTKFTNNAKPTADAKYRIFTPVYTSGGFFSSVVDLDAVGLQAEEALWNKPANAKDKKYKEGFSAALDVRVASWLKLSSVKIPGGFTASKNFAVDFSGEGLSETDFATTLPDTARFTGAGKVQAVAGGASAPAENNSKDWNKLFSVSVNPVTGEFSGTQVLKTTVGSKTTSKTIKVGGVLLVDGEVGDGEVFALGQYAVTPAGGSEITGWVSFKGPLEDNKTVATAGTYTVKLQQLASGTAKPSHAPADGATVKFTLAEDLQSIVFNGVKLPLSGDSRPTSLSYSNAPASPMKNVTVIVYLNFLGEIQGLAASYNQAIVKIPPELRNATFQNAVGGTAGFTKL